ncbi:MAG: acyl carrier protein [Anaerolineae bacterium]|nr:acyl carrier protein [Anaerolineae bacterium]
MTVATSLTETQIKETIIKLLKRIAPEADFSTLAPAEDIRAALDIDSFDFLQFLIGLNEEVGVEVPEADYGKLVSLQDLVSYLSARMG